MISTDSGPAHAAAALGVPLVVLYGIESPKVWLPRSSTGSAVVGLGGPPVLARADQISVDAVFQAWCSLADGAAQATAESGLELTLSSPSIQTRSVRMDPSASSSSLR